MFPVTESVLPVFQVSVPPAFTIRVCVVWLVLTVIVCPCAIVILSAGEGDPEGDQIAEVVQSPEAIETLLMEYPFMTVDNVTNSKDNNRKINLVEFIGHFFTINDCRSCHCCGHVSQRAPATY
jgi:hypothetical protein